MFEGLSPSAIEDLAELTRAYHAKGREPSTMKNLCRYRGYYLKLCESLGVDPWPADPLVVSQYLVAYCTGLKSVQSIDQAHSAITTGQREIAGAEWTKSQLVYITMVKRGLRKEFRRETRRKRPITLAVLGRMIKSVDFSTFRELQFATMMFLAHDACLRCKELLSLRWSDITWVMEGDVAVGARIRIRVSKSRYDEAPEHIEIREYTLGGQDLCGVSLLWVYMHHATALQSQADDGEAFLFPNPATGTGATSRQTFVSWVQQQLNRVGLEAKAYSGHSFRAGGATDLFAGGVSEAVIRLLGRWRSREAYLIYIRLDPSEQARLTSAGFSRAFAKGMSTWAAAAQGDGALDAEAYLHAYQVEFGSRS